MKKIIIFECDICRNQYRVENHDSIEKAKIECEACEARGYADPNRIDHYVINQIIDGGIRMTFCNLPFSVNKHHLRATSWAARDQFFKNTENKIIPTINDNYGEMVCAGGNDSFIEAMSNVEFYKSKKVVEFGPHFLRMVRYMRSIGLPAKYWNGESVVIYDKELPTNEEDFLPQTEEQKEEAIRSKTMIIVEPVLKPTIKDYKILKVDLEELEKYKKEGYSIFKRRAIYFTDYSYSEKVQYEELEGILNKFRRRGKIIFDKDIKITNSPPFDMSFQILFFDYGGVMGVGADDMIFSHCKHLVLDAKKNPHKDYIITSAFSSFVGYMKEAMEEFGYYTGDDVQENIYFGINNYLKKNNLFKEK